MNDLLVYESCRRLTQTVSLNWKDLSTKHCTRPTVCNCRPMSTVGRQPTWRDKS